MGYKMEFKRQQLNEFFVTHKEEEWFKQKYHPDDSVKRKGELRDFLKKRVEVFQEFLDSGKIKAKKLDCENQDDLIKLLDSVVIKLEGGTDFDLTVLDIPDPEDSKKDSNDKDDEDKKDPKSSTTSQDTFDDENAALMKKAKEFLNFMDPSDEKEKEESKKRKREEDEEKVPENKEEVDTEANSDEKSEE